MVEEDMTKFTTMAVMCRYLNHLDDSKEGIGTVSKKEPLKLVW